MNISLDFDETYTRDPESWNKFIFLFRAAGHKVFCVTYRYPSEGRQVIDALGSSVDGIYFTSRQQKSPYMYSQGIRIDVWIDDMPFLIPGDGTQIEF